MPGSSANLQGRPMTRSDQITDRRALIEALRALLHGGDESAARDTKARGWSFPHQGTQDPVPVDWYEGLQEIDAVLSEEVAVKLTPLPTVNLLEKIDDMTAKLETWFTAAVPVHHKRVMRYAFDEMAEIGTMLRNGRINAAEAQSRFDVVVAEADEVVDFSKFDV